MKGNMRKSHADTLFPLFETLYLLDRQQACEIQTCVCRHKHKCAHTHTHTPRSEKSSCEGLFSIPPQLGRTEYLVAVERETGSQQDGKKKKEFPI